jgi:hypothetical protein
MTPTPSHQCYLLSSQSLQNPKPLAYVCLSHACHVRVRSLASRRQTRITALPSTNTSQRTRPCLAQWMVTGLMVRIAYGVQQWTKARGLRGAILKGEGGRGIDFSCVLASIGGLVHMPTMFTLPSFFPRLIIFIRQNPSTHVVHITTIT